uniref:Uncharacterized protein n=1 Tax=Latimeria chalumnae TaxID=7897 RepID=H3AS13_LATCH
MSLISLLLENAVSSLLAFLLSLFFLYYFFSTKKSSGYRFPPGPTPLPLIGNLHLMDLSRPQITLTKLGEQYGGLFTIYLGLQKYVVLAGYEVVKDALVNHPDQFADRGHIPVFYKIMKDNGLVMSSGEKWKQLRRFTVSILRDFGMGKKTIEDRIIEEVGFFINVFKSKMGQPFNAANTITMAVSNIICSVVFGHRFDYDDKTFLHLINLNEEVMKFSGSPHTMLYHSFPFLEFIPGDHHKVFEGITKFYDFVRGLRGEYESKLNPDNVRSYIEAFFLKQQKESDSSKTTGISYFCEEDFLAMIINLFSAGTDTTSNTIQWGLLLMMKYPQIQEKVQEEIWRVIGSDKSPVSEDRKNMPYTNAVLHEIQRFGNIAPMGLQHQTSMDTHFRGYFLPKGTQIIPLLTSVLYDKTQWEKPDEFYPPHFLDAEGRFMKRDAFMPFSAGRRVCAGENLAKMELFIFFITLLQKFRFSPPPGVTDKDLDLTPCFGITSSPVPYELCAEPY